MLQPYFHVHHMSTHPDPHSLSRDELRRLSRRSQFRPRRSGNPAQVSLTSIQVLTWSYRRRCSVIWRPRMSSRALQPPFSPRSTWLKRAESEMQEDDDLRVKQRSSHFRSRLRGQGDFPFSSQVNPLAKSQEAFERHLQRRGHRLNRGAAGCELELAGRTVERPCVRGGPRSCPLSLIINRESDMLRGFLHRALPRALAWRLQVSANVRPWSALRS